MHADEIRCYKKFQFSLLGETRDSTLQVRWRLAGDTKTSRRELRIPVCSPKKLHDFDRRERFANLSSCSKNPVPNGKAAASEPEGSNFETLTADSTEDPPHTWSVAR
ncbi:hypothetical protein AVEN_157993-1 [Araneus ventricosus]|uniref:Uncharacterized protein n=1 Tax=Araneus ventricosus TaxID=182803 RepID=A0A4Y2MKP6_ARAVE|nr:hypothetical protein AVEN_157993-1 [Araneus ventricosus]